MTKYYKAYVYVRDLLELVTFSVILSLLLVMVLNVFPGNTQPTGKWIDNNLILLASLGVIILFVTWRKLMSTFRLVFASKKSTRFQSTLEANKKLLIVSLTAIWVLIFGAYGASSSSVTAHLSVNKG